MGFVKSIVCKTLTIRGVSKIGTANDRFIKCTWIIFVFTMSFLLLYSTGKLVEEFLKYDVVIQISIKSNDHSTEFPTFSFCHHNPFGPSAQKFWQNHSIISPTLFNTEIRRLINQSFANQGYVHYLLNTDSKRFYYNHLTTEQTYKLGWSEAETFIMCTTLKPPVREVSRGRGCEVKVRMISLPEYFNCFSITPLDTDPHERVTSLTLVIRVNNGSSDSINDRKAFVNGIFTQLSGIRGMLHVKDTYPAIDSYGLNLEPGKVAEVSYEPIRTIKKATPKNPCFKEKRHQIRELNEYFEFTQEDCINAIRGRKILEQCQCYSSDFMRPGVPNQTHPNCGNVMSIVSGSLEKRIYCIRKVGKYVKTNRNLIFANECQPSCIDYSYRTSLSVTHWLPTTWQLGWMLDISDYFKNWSPEHKDKTNPSIDRYIKSKDISDYPGATNYMEKDNFIMVVLRRRSFDTTEHREKLTLDQYNLISRFGGLCSLCLGLTCAFLMEVVEIIYIWTGQSSKNVPQPTPQTVDSNLKKLKPPLLQSNSNENWIPQLYEPQRNNPQNGESLHTDNEDRAEDSQESQVWLSSI